MTHISIPRKNIGKTPGWLYHLGMVDIPPIYCDLGDGLLLFNHISSFSMSKFSMSKSPCWLNHGFNRRPLRPLNQPPFRSSSPAPVQPKSWSWQRSSASPPRLEMRTPQVDLEIWGVPKSWGEALNISQC